MRHFEEAAISPEAQDVEALRETLDQLREEVSTLRASRTRLLLAADADRRHIEHELHDGVQQHLVALAMKLQLVGEALEKDASRAPTLLAGVAEDVQEAIDEAARLAQRILPPRLASGGLAPALRSWASGAGTRATIVVRIERAPPSESVEALYFCCLAALELVGAGEVTVAVHDEAGLLAFEVAGHRAATAAPVSGATLELSDRVDALGGGLEIGLKPDGRVVVSGSIPIGSGQPLSAR